MITPDTPSDDTLSLRRAYGCFPSGVTAVCGLLDDDHDAMPPVFHGSRFRTLAAFD